MKTSLKAGFAQIFFCCPKNYELPKIWGGCSPPRTPGPYAYATQISTVCSFYFVILRNPEQRKLEFFCTALLLNL